MTMMNVVSVLQENTLQQAQIVVHPVEISNIQPKDLKAVLIVFQVVIHALMEITVTIVQLDIILILMILAPSVQLELILQQALLAVPLVRLSNIQSRELLAALTVLQVVMNVQMEIPVTLVLMVTPKTLIIFVSQTLVVGLLILVNPVLVLFNIIFSVF